MMMDDDEKKFFIHFLFGLNLSICYYLFDGTTNDYYNT